MSDWPHLKQFDLADPDYMKPTDCDLGADIYKNIMLEGMKMELDNSPMAQNSSLSWILLGLMALLSESRLPGGKFRLTSKSFFSGSRQIATSSFKRLQAHLAKNLNSQFSYFKFMQEYLHLGLMEKIQQDEIHRPDFYCIPHHSEVNKGKLIVVFNESAPAFA